MEVEVKLFASLKRGRPERGKLQLPGGSRVSDLLDALGFSPDDVGILMVNRKDGRFDQELRDSDVITLIPPIGGG